MAKKINGRWTFSAEELERQFAEASRLGEEALKGERRAASAYYDGQHRALALQMLDGSFIAIPVQNIQGLADASPEQLAQVELTLTGTTLQWDALGVDLSVDGLVNRIFGTRAWMAKLGRRGGRATTHAKAAASRVNGQKGGRPPKTRPQPTIYVFNCDRLRVDASLFQQDIDLIELKVSGQSQQTIKDLIRYKRDLTKLERATSQPQGSLSGQVMERSTVVPAHIEGAEEASDYYATLAPAA